MKNNIISSYWKAYRLAIRGIMLPGKDIESRDISYWRDEIFCNLVSYLVPLSTIALVPSVYMAFRNGFPVVAISDLIALALVISIMSIRSMTLALRKIIFMGIFYCLSVILLYYVSTSGAGMLFLLVLTVLTAVIYSPRAAYYSALANAIICIVFGILIYNGVHVSIDADNQIGTWIAVSSNLVLLSIISAEILNLILQGLDTTIKDRIAAENESKKAYTRLLFHIENEPLGFIEWDSQLRIKSWSKRSQDIFGWTETECKDNEWGKCIQVYEEDVTAAGMIIEELLNGTVDRNTVQHRNYRSDGTVIWCEWFNSVLRDENGTTVTIMSLVQDITARKISEAEIRKANRLYNFISAINQSIVHIKDWEILIDHVCGIAAKVGLFKTAWIGMLDAEGKLHMVSVHGDPEITAGMKNHSGLDYSDVRLRETPTGRVLDTGKYAVSNDVTCDPAMYAWKEEFALHGIMANISLPIKKFGKTVGVFGLSADTKHFFDSKEILLLTEAAGDISFALEIYENDKLRMHAGKQLQLSEANLFAIIENTDAHIYSIDRDFRYITFNSLLKNTLLQSYGLEIQPGDKVFGFLEKLHVAEAKEWEDRYTEAFAGKSLQFTKVFDVGGFKSYANFSINPIWEDNIVTGLSCFARDITSQKQAEAEIAILNESLERKVEARTAELQDVNKELETFSYTVSHDLQSPLRILSGFSQILLTDYKDKLDNDGKEYLGLIDSSAKRMSLLIHDLLHFSRLGKEALTISEVNIQDTVTVIINELSMAHPDYTAEIIVEQMASLTCDPGLIRVVWSNLIGNALKYSSKKAAPIVEIGMQNTDGKHIYYVRDNGDGFDMRFANKLFAVFQRMHHTEEFEGTGVGLATVHRIITKHGGKIWAEGKKGEGATFYFCIPQLNLHSCN